MIIICDIDGTAANINHRRHHVEGKKEGKKVNWGKFFDAMVDDVPNRWCKQLLNALHKDGHEVVFVTGRPETHRKHTEEWLNTHYKEVFNFPLLMRPAEDYRPDFEIKEEIYNDKLKKLIGVRTCIVIDDRKQVVDMWRSHGLTVLQCDEGDF